MTHQDIITDATAAILAAPATAWSWTCDPDVGDKSFIRGWAHVALWGEDDVTVEVIVDDSDDTVELHVVTSVELDEFLDVRITPPAGMIDAARKAAR